MRLPIRYAGLELVHLTEEDMDALHEYFGSLFRSYGIDDEPGGVLDHCVASCTRIAAAAIEKRRAMAGDRVTPSLVWSNPAAEVPA